MMPRTQSLPSRLYLQHNLVRKRVQSELMEERHKTFLWMKNFVKTQYAENHGGRKASFHGKREC